MKFARLLLRCVRFAAVASVTFSLLLLSYIAVVGWVWLRDVRTALPPPEIGKNDFGRFSTATPAEVIVPERDTARATQQLQELVKRAGSEGRKISVAGSQHSMGGHTLFSGGLSVDMRCDAFRHISNVFYRNDVPIVRVGAGVTWHDLLAALDREGWSVAVMQSNDDFTVGGSFSVNCHGWNDARIIRFMKTDNAGCGVKNTIVPNGGNFGVTKAEIGLARAVLRASAGSNFGKLGRWSIERIHGQTHRTVSRNGILRTPSEWFANRDPNYVEILHEYFIPPDRLSDFLARARPLLREKPDIDLLNVTVRKVKKDEITMLAYAREDVFGLVMLFRYPSTHPADDLMADTTRRLIAAALECRGSYYLPYRPHATLDQFRQAYPRYASFSELKLKYDSGEVFENMFYQNYIRPGAE